MAEGDLHGGQASADATRSAFGAFLNEPLAEEPFLIAGRAAMAAGRLDEGERLLKEARRRNPRSRAARFSLLDIYLRSDRVQEAGVELAVLQRIVPGMGEVIVPQLARMLEDRQSRPTLLQLMSSDPGLQQAVLAHLAGSGGDPDLILRLAAAAPATAAAPEGLPWQRQLLTILVERGEVLKALRLWRSFASLPEGPDEKAVYDEFFKSLPGAAPFNWSAYEGSAGIVEQSGKAGLNVQFFGRESADLASQMMVLRPGRYRLSSRVDGSAKGDDSRLAWRVFCRGNDVEPIAELNLREITAAPRLVSVDFTVPASCRGQWLKLAGIAGEFPGTQTVSVSAVSVTGAGRP
ncbi:MAG TPA: tetratricopeptide repeat protein [Chloroflexota bacterium]|nr:tetratricopeptide repeat protein [Chloroflexota bacterium]